MWSLTSHAWRRFMLERTLLERLWPLRVSWMAHNWSRWHWWLGVAKECLPWKRRQGMEDCCQQEQSHWSTRSILWSILPQRCMQKVSLIRRQPLGRQPSWRRVAWWLLGILRWRRQKLRQRQKRCKRRLKKSLSSCLPYDPIFSRWSRRRTPMRIWCFPSPNIWNNK